MTYRGMRGLAALAAAGLALAGCAVTPATLPVPSPSASPTAVCASAGSSSEAVFASGELGAAPIIVVDGPLRVGRVERSVLIEGAGDAVALGDLVSVAFTTVNATSGDRSPGTTRARVLLQPGAALPGLLTLLECSTVGSRIAGVVPSSQAFGTAGQPDLGIGPEDDVVFVLDVLDIVPLQASGEVAELPEDFPDLDLAFADDGEPEVGIPDADPPATLTWAPLLVGDGAEVGAEDEFLVQFQAINWTTGDVFDTTWGDAPRSLLGILPGVDAAIVGSRVGSRLVIVVPPADGFGAAGAPSSGIAPTDTVVYVVDILATTPPA